MEIKPQAISLVANKQTSSNDEQEEGIIFVAGVRDFHAMDWYRTVRRVVPSKRVAIATDLIESEGYDLILAADDRIIKLLIIDRFLFKRQSRLGNVWRNLVKVVVAPIQALRLRAIARANPSAVFHANPMYYMFVCWIAGIPFVGTPQGSEILIRAKRSFLYRFFARKSLKAATELSVDSSNMQRVIFDLSGRTAHVIQNGIDLEYISSVPSSEYRTNVVSIRGFASLYRIRQILEARNDSESNHPMQIMYPLQEEGYRNACMHLLKPGDQDIGRLKKSEMYKLLTTAKLVISIPESDSSPRSVYESIFCGCAVAVTWNAWIEAVPDCMRARLFIVDLEDRYWFDKAMEFANHLTSIPYVPSDAARLLFDERLAMRKSVELLYGRDWECRND